MGCGLYSAPQYKSLKETLVHYRVQAAQTGKLGPSEGERFASEKIFPNYQKYLDVRKSPPFASLSYVEAAYI